MQNKVVESIQKYKLIEQNDKIVLGVSGGPDSMAMLNILYEIIESNKILIDENTNKKNIASFEIIVAHINHMLREEANEEEEYVRNYCEERNILFFSKKVDIGKVSLENKIGTEEAGRNIRYAFFEEILKNTNSNKIAVAHNKNDKAETIILNILRGTGVAGLKGIEIKREKTIRPILECSREEIEKYCTDKNLNPKIDRSNFENIYRRNRIRNKVIPYIKEEFNPNIIDTLDRLSELVCEEEKYFNNYVEKIYNEIVIKDLDLKSDDIKEFICLDLKKFNINEKVIKSRLIIYTISKLYGSSKGIEKIHIKDILSLCEKNIGNKYLTPNKNLKVLVNKGKVIFEKID